MASDFVNSVELKMEIELDHYFVLYNPDIFEIFYSTCEGGLTDVC